ncbi:MAG: hypothetical protein ISS26_05600 [Candidatus Omnitrophica bacterium]|nr:hypothetical protein [Candidatus Omnitrophota bacterium]
MKKALSMMLAVAVVFGFSVAAYAADFTVNVPLSVAISEMFGFTLDKYSHDFGLVNAGAGAETNIGIFCRSNHGVVWYMAIYADEFENAAGDTIDSNPNFWMAAWTYADPASEEADGTFVLDDDPVPTVESDFYQSTIAEGSDAFIPLTLGLYLSVPMSQPSGYYTTNLVLTMHE